MGLCPLPGRGGDPAGALVRIADFAPGLVITLTLAEEMAAQDIADLPDRLAALGIDWQHYPIADFGTPQPAAEPAWRVIADEARAVLDAGGRVLIHCKAGRGRTGAAALRLMIEAGEDPEAALTRLRAARAGTVETEAQRRWAEAGRPARPAP